VCYSSCLGYRIGQQKGAWKPHWLRLLDLLSDAVPADWTVIVLTDRGLYAKWLYRAIQSYGRNPFMRINQQGLVRVHEGHLFERNLFGTQIKAGIRPFSGLK